MLEYVFKKSELKKLIDESGDAQDDNVVVKLEFAGKLGAFTAQVTAYCEGRDEKRINGCPRPPGCE